MQIADVWSTHQGLKHSCVIEKNPILVSVTDEKPNGYELVTYKGIFVFPIYWINYHRPLTAWELMPANIISTYPVWNNLQVLDRVRDNPNCPKQ